MKKILLMMLLLSIAGCQTKETKTDSQTSDLIVEKTKETKSDAKLDDLMEIAAKSQCKQYYFKPNRGKPPVGYLKGLVLTYARALCQPYRSDVVLISSDPGSSSKDALAHYSSIFKSKGMTDSNLRNTYTLLTGLGMRESSGKWCSGTDASATNHKHDTCEAGLFQPSFNTALSSKASPELMRLYLKYKESKHGCFSDVFKEGVPKEQCTAARLKNYGVGEGVNFQKQTKECPSFAVEYAAVAIRTNYPHFGPLKRHEAEVRSECSSMLMQVEHFVGMNPEICEGL